MKDILVYCVDSVSIILPYCNSSKPNLTLPLIYYNSDVRELSKSHPSLTMYLPSAAMELYPKFTSRLFKIIQVPTDCFGVNVKLSSLRDNLNFPASNFLSFYV